MKTNKYRFSTCLLCCATRSLLVSSCIVTVWTSWWAYPTMRERTRASASASMRLCFTREIWRGCAPTTRLSYHPLSGIDNFLFLSILSPPLGLCPSFWPISLTPSTCLKLLKGVHESGRSHIILFLSFSFCYQPFLEEFDKQKGLPYLLEMVHESEMTSSAAKFHQFF